MLLAAVLEMHKKGTARHQHLTFHDLGCIQNKSNEAFAHLNMFGKNKIATIKQTFLFCNTINGLVYSLKIMVIPNNSSNYFRLIFFHVIEKGSWHDLQAD